MLTDLPWRVPQGEVQAQDLDTSQPHSAIALTGSARGAHRTHPRTEDASQPSNATRAEVHPCIAILHFCTHAPAQHFSCKDHAHMRTNHKANPTRSDPLPLTPERVLGSHVRTQRTINAATQQPWVAALHAGVSVRDQGQWARRERVDRESDRQKPRDHCNAFLSYQNKTPKEGKYGGLTGSPFPSRKRTSRDPGSHLVCGVTPPPDRAMAKRSRREHKTSKAPSRETMRQHAGNYARPSMRSRSAR